MLIALGLGAEPVEACALPEGLDRERARVVSVHDGDSVRLEDDRRVRLIGINAPELAREGVAVEPLAQAAGEALRKQVAGQEVWLVYDQERQDHYGRTLAHLFTPEGQSLEAMMLRQGLGFHIAIAPNTTLAGCLSEAERVAREASRGVWGHSGWRAKPASELNGSHAGFQRISGQIVTISRAGGSVWLELDGPAVVQIPDSVWKKLADQGIVQGATVEVRGWLVDRSESAAARRGFKPLVMRISSEFSVERTAEP